MNISDNYAFPYALLITEGKHPNCQNLRIFLSKQNVLSVDKVLLKGYE